VNAVLLGGGYLLQSPMVILFMSIK
jgi:hypothetical protein